MNINIIYAKECAEFYKGYPILKQLRIKHLKVEKVNFMENLLFIYLPSNF